MTIIELCRLLPGSEPELRARADEFNLAIEQALQVPTRWTARDYMNNIADAKAATDAVLALGAKSLEIYCREAAAYSCAVLVPNSSRGYVEWVNVEAEASTEPLARSACALLAANAIKRE